MKILLGFHGGTSKEGPMLALEQAKAFNAEVVIVTSVMFGDKGETLESEMSEARQNLEEVQKDFQGADIPCKTEILTRGVGPGNAIVQYAKENQCDLIIIGVRLRSRVGKFLIGSNSQYVILKAPCPVLTYKET